MNKNVPEEYVEIVHRLALGIECIDLLRERGLMHPVRIDIERGLPHSMKKPKDSYCCSQTLGRVPSSFCRHTSGRYALLYYPGLGKHINLRIYDHSSYYVPRRLQVPLLAMADLEQPEKNHPSLRQRRPVLFPGAAYDVSGKATGLRGRVMRDGKAMRWAFIEAVLPGSVSLVGRARSDEHGEFLLLLSSETVPSSDLTRTIQVQVSVSGPFESLPIPEQKEIPYLDKFWDLPLEEVPEPGLADNVSSGNSFPAGYATPLSSVRDVKFEIGRILTGNEVAPLEFIVA